ncbi:hypothetical protein FHL15_000042 [Xylaria flabelliformis]|uniref:Uncharacterized protein n=1 Tax=Xylaria flabelliformis TaxID=2512241 RepID=A0A553IEU4_9PEZI|nr:hypothetical protein FHL15_000042 [Xylaria flabelliformis]
MPSDIILHVVEQMDTETRENFLATNNGIRRLIESYEHSISKNRATTFTLPPLGNVLSSSASERRLLRKNTFAMVREIELRDNRIDRLIRECPRIFCLSAPPWLPCLTVQQQARLWLILKRALYQCDRIADIAANISDPQIPPEYYHAITDRVYEWPSALSSITEAEFEFNPLTRPNARPKQIEYIESLPLEDIAGIFILVNMLGYGLTCICSDTGYERKTIIEECVLRHGTWFVWSRLRGDQSMQELAGCIISAGMAELKQWETGAIYGPPGLKMRLTRRFNELAGGATSDEVILNIEKLLEKLVVGDDKPPAGWESDCDDEE